MKNDRNRFYLTLSGVTLAHVLLFWAVHNMNNQDVIVPPNMNTMNFVLMSSNSVDAVRQEASAATPAAAPKPKPTPKAPTPKADPKIKPVVTKNAKPDLKAEQPEPKPEPAKPTQKADKTPAATQNSSNTDTTSKNTTNTAGSSGGSNNSNAPSSSSQGSTTAPTHLGGYLNNPNPPYPAQSLEAEEEGSVRIRVVVEANGRPSNVAVANSSGYRRLDASAVKTVREKYRFSPALKNGQPVAQPYTFTVHFNLPKGRNR